MVEKVLAIQPILRQLSSKFAFSKKIDAQINLIHLFKKERN